MEQVRQKSRDEDILIALEMSKAVEEERKRLEMFEDEELMVKV